MEKNTLWAVTLSTLFLLLWWTFFQPPKPANTPAKPASPQKTEQALASTPQALTTETGVTEGREEEVVVEAKNYKAVFTTRGAAVKHWYLKEKDGTYTDLVLGKETPLATFPGSLYTYTQKGRTVVFTSASPQGWKITKTYDLSDDYLHNLRLDIVKTQPTASQPAVQIDWGPGIGTDQKDLKDNTAVTRALGFPLSKPHELQKYKVGDYPAGDLQWAAIDNRYFLAAFIPQANAPFNTVSVYRENKKQPYGLMLAATKPQDTPSQSYALQFYIGPKGHSHLKSLNLNLEHAVDFGFFGFLGKIALSVLLFFYGITGNYGWAIIILTILIQIIVLPLTLKSFKASVAMKTLQPHIKALQVKYKDDPKRLNMEMLNLYKTQKVNPLGGCLPMLLQLPIFWALFTTLRNAFELRGAHWLLWVKDLSAPDTLFHIGVVPVNILPLIMGVGMFLQQKMMTVATDPTQKQMMYLMPVIFTFMFWGFPSGLVIYWLTNSIVTIIEQYVIMRRQEQTAVPAVIK